MTTTCKNCNQDFKGHFCNNCGQTAQTHKINLHLLWHDIQHGLFHFDGGLLYTIKELYTRPGDTIREFMDGKRVRHFKPVSLVIILATVYGLLYHGFHIATDENLQSSEPGKIVSEKVNEWMGSHYHWVTLMTLPLLALGSYLGFKRQGYNFVEHLVLNAFLAGQRLVVHIVSFPLLYIFNGTHYLMLIVLATNFMDFILICWGYSQFFNKVGRIKALLLSVLSYMIYFLSLMLLATLITVICVMIMFSNGTLKTPGH